MNWYGQDILWVNSLDKVSIIDLISTHVKKYIQHKALHFWGMKFNLHTSHGWSFTLFDTWHSNNSKISSPDLRSLHSRKDIWEFCWGGWVLKKNNFPLGIHLRHIGTTAVQNWSHEVWFSELLHYINTTEEPSWVCLLG